MIEALMYGITPSVKNRQLPMMPPESAFMMPNAKPKPPPPDFVTCSR
jgi:hypothetical protein